MLPRILRTENFRLAALFVVCFLALATVLGAIVYWQVQQAQTATLLDAVDADIATIRNGFRDEGVKEAREIVQQRLGSSEYQAAHAPIGYLLLQDTQKGWVAGNLPAMQPWTGLLTIAEPGNRRGAAGSMLGRGEFLSPTLYLFAARDLAPMVAMRTHILKAFAWIAAVALVLAIAGGLFYSMRFMRRIDVMATTCHAIVGGRFSERMPLRGSGDELDRLALSINAMLDRIEALLDNLRQVSSDIAHDLRTPLTHLRQRLENALSQSRSAEDHAAAVTLAIGDTDELLRVFNALLRISQIEAGSRMAGLTPLNLDQTLDRLYETYLPVAEDSGHVLSRHISPRLAMRGDAELLMQLFVNLLENALRHTPAGTHIQLSAHSAANRITVSVTDSGPGIPAIERDKVLRRFYRLSRSRSTPGNGLGLALAAAIVNLHGGAIELDDQAPGLRVSVTFPACA
ncbi:MAG: HAMP domain-containing protein [Proteobacteria bacterium]|nr:HAMP domain-containing protein [Pseudomonadota bacterium]